jgi:hypothetical protein
MFTGEAAGTAAAMAIADSVLPHEVDGREVRRRILGVRESHSPSAQ